MKHLPLFALAIASLTSACTSLSGLDANSKFACPVPDGVLCADMKTVYDRAQAGTLPSQQAKQGSGTPDAPTPRSQAAVAPTAVIATKPLYSGLPIRSTPQVLRIWVNAWVDGDGDLHDQSYIYITVSGGDWILDHNKRRITDTYGPVLAPPKGAAGNPPVTPMQPNSPTPGRALGTSPLPMEVYRQSGNNLLPPGYQDGTQ